MMKNQISFSPPCPSSSSCIIIIIFWMSEPQETLFFFRIGVEVKEQTILSHIKETHRQETPEKTERALGFPRKAHNFEIRKPKRREMAKKGKEKQRN